MSSSSLIFDQIVVHVFSALNICTLSMVHGQRTYDNKQDWHTHCKVITMTSQ